MEKYFGENVPKLGFGLMRLPKKRSGKIDTRQTKQMIDMFMDAGLTYFDYYLLHALQAGNYKTYDQYHLWDFVKEQKAKGLIKHWGFSFHATPDILDEVLTAHPDAEFVQLQLNYADWENPQVTARENYEVARKHGKSIVVMEPARVVLLLIRRKKWVKYSKKHLRMLLLHHGRSVTQRLWMESLRCFRGCPIWSKCRITFPI